MYFNYNIVALSLVQEGMLYHSLQDENSNVYITDFVLKIRGSVNKEKLELAWNSVVSNHQLLRTVYRWKGLSHPVQIIFDERLLKLDYKEESFEVEDLNKFISYINSKGVKVSLDNHPIKLSLYRLKKDEYVLHIQYHHICMDGWSLGILVEQLWTYYDGLKCSSNKGFFDYENYIIHLGELKSNTVSGDYWSNYLSSNSSISLPKHNNIKSHGIKSFGCQLSEIFFGDLDRFCKDNQLTLASVFYAAWAIILSKYNNSDLVCFGTTVAGRDNRLSEIENSIGLYIQTPPLQVEGLSSNITLQEIVHKIHQDLLDRDEHKEFPITEIKSVNNIKHNLFDSIVVIENYPISKRLKEFSSSLDIVSYATSETTNFDLTLEINLLGSAHLKLSYDSHKYHGFLIQGVLKNLEKILSAIAYHANGFYSELCLLDQAEYSQCVINFNNTEKALHGPTHLAEAWMKTSQQYNDQTAIYHGDTQVTFGELDTMSNLIAHNLFEQGVSQHALVAVKCRPSIDTIALLIAISKLGAAYVPIDISTPEERVNKILANDIKHIIYQENLEKLKARSDGANPLPAVNYSKDDLVYTIFTSGSTGEPKGVMLEHHTVMNYIYWAIEQYHDVSPAIYPLFTSLAFDLTVTSIWCPLISGGKIEVIDKGSFEALSDIASSNFHSTIKMTPSQLNLFNQIIDDSKSTPSTFILGGEQLELKLCSEVTKKIQNKVRIFNEYGPTEATVGCMIYEYKPNINGGSVVPIGKPINNSKIYILDRYLNPQPTGVPGEMYIGGNILARGYLNREDLTKERFIDSPFEQGARLYKTGDIAFFNLNGEIEYIGRADNQIKLRGYRVELDEIAAKIKSLDGCQKAVVIVKTLQGEEQLVAYYMSDQSVNDEYLRTQLVSLLPNYMVPNFFKRVDEIKLTRNGKIDLSSLPAIKLNKKINIDDNKSSCKEKIIKAFSTVLEIETIDLYTSFFELGANSLKLLRITNILNEFLPSPLRVVDFFTFTNMSLLISYVEHGEKVDEKKTVKEIPLNRRSRMTERRDKMRNIRNFSD